MMYFSPWAMFLIMSFAVLVNVAVYVLAYFIPAIALRLALRPCSKMSLERRKSLAKLVGILSVILLGAGAPAISYFRASLSYHSRTTDNISSRNTPVRPKHVALITVNASGDSGGCGELCQRLLLSKEVETVTTAFGSGGSPVSSTYRLEHAGFCTASPDFKGGSNILNETIAAAVRGDCIVTASGRPPSAVVGITLASGDGPDSARYVEIRNENELFYKNTALKYNVLMFPFVIHIGMGSLCTDVYFGDWFDRDTRDKTFSKFLTQGLRFSLEIPKQYTSVRGRDNLKDLVNLKSEQRFPGFVNEYTKNLCIEVSSQLKYGLPKEKEEIFNIFRSVMLDERFSVTEFWRCAEIFEPMLETELPSAIAYQVVTGSGKSDNYYAKKFAEITERKILNASVTELQPHADAVFKLVTEQAANAMMAFWPRLGTLGNNDPSRFLLGRAAVNNSASTEAIVGICNADRKWASSFLPELEEVLSKLDIFAANARGEPKISLISGAAALSRFGDEAASKRLIGRLPRDLQDKARAEVGKIVNDAGELPCSRYLN